MIYYIVNSQWIRIADDTGNKKQHLQEIPELKHGSGLLPGVRRSNSQDGCETDVQADRQTRQWVTLAWH